MRNDLHSIGIGIGFVSKAVAAKAMQIRSRICVNFDNIAIILRLYEYCDNIAIILCMAFIMDLHCWSDGMVILFNHASLLHLPSFAKSSSDEIMWEGTGIRFEYA